MSILVLLIILLFAAIHDRRKLKIPNVLFPVSILSALVLYAVGVIDTSIPTVLINFLIIFVPLILIWVMGTILSFKVLGAGDVKLLSVLPFFLSLEDTLLVISGSVLLSVILSIGKTNVSNMKESLKELHYFLFYGIPGPSEAATQTRIAFAPFIFLSTLLFGIYIYIY